jgi:thiopeptide-type bacteriocin biosynthesis protein
MGAARPMSHSHWTSFHLFRSDPLDDFIKTAVAPFVIEVLAGKLASAFFFIRYWEGGQHIRLRLRTTSPSRLASRTRTYFDEYFKKNPSSSRNVELSQAIANDSVQESQYEPEVSRYGGPGAIAISERQFEASSRTVFDAIAERQWSYESVIGTALQLHIIFAKAMGFTLKDATWFFAEMAERFAAGPGWLPAGLTLDRAIGLFSKAYAGQRDRLVALHREVWSTMEQGDLFEQEWANRWALENINVAKRLRRARGLEATEPWADAERAILRSYVHMTNNRLGVLNQDEAYLGYVLMHGLQGVE